MDADGFDTLARSLTDRRSRRGALATGLGGTLGMAGLAKTDAKKKKCPPCKKRKQGTCKKKLPNGTSCPGGTCQDGRCAAPSCRDGTKNGTESDVDCGGTCPRCSIGKTCTTRNDCTSARCVSGTCQTCVNPNTDCGTETGGGMCACRESVAGPRICTKSACRFLAGGACTSCVAGEQCTVAGGGIECCLPCGA